MAFAGDPVPADTKVVTDGALRDGTPEPAPPLDDDERMAKLFARARSDSEPVAPGSDIDLHVGAGAGMGAHGTPPAPPPAMVWPDPPVRSHHHRRVWPAVTLTVVAVLLVGAGVAAYELSRPAVDTDSAVTAAVTTTMHAKTADVAMSVTIASGGTGVTIAGNGDSNLADDASNLTLTYLTQGQPLTERAVIDGSTGYYNLGPLVGYVVPGKSWISLSLGKTGSGSKNIGTGGMFTDPNTLIAVIGAEGTAVRSLGWSDVGGARAHEYAIHLGPAGIRRALSSQVAPSSMRAEMSLAHYNRLDYVVAVDNAEHITQIRTTGDYSVAGQDFTVAATMDMSNYGTPVSVVAPPAREVVSYQHFEMIAAQDQGTSTT